MDADAVFKALADPTRRRLLDVLRARGGRTLGELCVGLGMTRQAVTQHLARLEVANLVSTIRRGREKLHYLNPVPLHEIYSRWIEKYERHHLDILRALKEKAEGEPHGPAAIRVRDVHRDHPRKTLARAPRRRPD